MPGRFIPPDHSLGDENTIGGYMAVHGRPAAFEGPDGLSYSVAIETDRTGEPERPWGAFLLFLQWKRLGPQGIGGHLETPFLAWGETSAEARAALGRMTLAEVKATLDALVHAQTRATRRWWDVMREEE